ncbi:MAG: cyclophilin-like fold protein [Planctomycetota bacterium]
MPSIRIKADSVEMTAQLNDSPTAKDIWDALPIDSTARLYGREVYFDIPVDRGEEDAQATVPPGTIAFWPVGNCFCIFFGQTPASPVNVLGTLDGDPNAFEAVQSGESIRLEKAEA